jgi:arabinofuranosyltransferase
MVLTEASPRIKPRIVALAAIVAIFLVASRHFVVDDGLIYARFLANALAGKGLVFNAGESVNALTSPLFTYLLLGVSWLFRGNIIVAEHLLFGITFLGACIAAERVIPYSGFAVASTAYFYILIGLETSLFLWMMMLVAAAYANRRYDWLPVLLTLTLLTRFEGGLLIPIVGYLLWKQRKFPRLIAFIPAVLILLAYFAINHHLYGSMLPNSASSKFGQAQSGYWGKWPTGFLRLHGWALLGTKGLFHWTIYVVPLMLFFGFRGWRLMRGQRINDVLAPFWLGLAAFYTLSNMPSYHWYYGPLIFIVIIYAIKGVPRTQTAVRWAAAIVIVAGLTNVWFLTRWGPDWDYVNVANWINSNSPENATVETVELGQIGWYTQRHVIDILGLTFPKNAIHIAHRDPASWLAEDKPDYIIIHKPLWIYEAVTAAHPEYQEVPYHSGNVYILHRTEGPPSQDNP